MGTNELKILLDQPLVIINSFKSFIFLHVHFEPHIVGKQRSIFFCLLWDNETGKGIIQCCSNSTLAFRKKQTNLLLLNIKANTIFYRWNLRRLPDYHQHYYNFKKICPVNRSLSDILFHKSDLLFIPTKISLFTHMSPNHCDLIEDNSKLNVLAMRKNRKYETSVMQKLLFKYCIQ